MQGYSFEQVDNHTFVASHSDGLSDALYLGDMVQFSNQGDPDVFYKITSVVGDNIGIDLAFAGGSSASSHVTRFFGFRHVIYFDGHAMHMNQNGDMGFRPQQDTNFVASTSGSCQAARAYHNNVLKPMDEITGAHFSAEWHLPMAEVKILLELLKRHRRSKYLWS